MTDTEKKDIYIAAGVGGLALVLILLFVHSGTAASAVNANNEPVPGLDGYGEPVLPTAYNYNVMPYNPEPAIKLAGGNDNSGDDCCNTCGPMGGGNFMRVNVAQFSTLLGTGAG